MTAVECPHCDRLCGGPQGLAAHIRSMHPAALAAHEAPPAAPATGLVWEDPPVANGRTPVEKLIEPLIPELRRNPGKWARLRDFPIKSSAASAKGRLAKMPHLADIQFAARITPTGSALYGRYTGE